jgi:hypothetical protein
MRSPVRRGIEVVANGDGIHAGRSNSWFHCCIRSVGCRSKLVISKLLVNPDKRSRFHLNPKRRVSLFMHRLQAESEKSERQAHQSPDK